MESNRFSPVCYGVAFAWVAFWPIIIWYSPESLDPNVHEILPNGLQLALWLILTSPIPGALVGAGIGNLYGQRWQGALIGFVAPIVILLALRKVVFPLWNGGRSLWIRGIQRLFSAPVYIRGMARDHQHNPDPNVNAARIVGESTATNGGAPADLEAAWLAWSAGIQKVDERAMTLLRAAFEAGWEARDR
jgi:hypothetical protein